MAESSAPTGGAAVRSVTDAQYEQLMSALSADGLFGSPADTAPVFADSSGRQVKIRASKKGLLRGWFWDSGTTDTTKSVTTNTAGATRIDRVVLRFDRTAFTVTTVVKAGTAGSGLPPALTRDAGTTGVWEIPMARITLVNNYTTIASTDVVSEAAYLGSASLLYVADVATLDAIPSPHAGQVAMVAGSVNLLYTYIAGTGWRRTDWNSPWGFIGGNRYPGTGNVGVVFNTYSDTALRTNPTTLLVGRAYRIDWGFPLAPSASGDVSFYEGWQVRRPNGTGLEDVQWLAPMPVYQAWVRRGSIEYVPAANETNDLQLWGIVLKTAGGTLNWAAVQRSGSTYFRIRDMGPASLIPAL